MSDNISIRAAAEADASGIAERLGELGYPTTAHQIVSRLADLSKAGAIVIVAVQEEKVVGVLSAQCSSVLHRSTDDFRITSLVVAEKARGKGIGRRLVAEAERRAREQRCGRVEVTSGSARTSAHEFYLGLGYEYTGKRFCKSLH